MIPKTIHYCWFGRNPLPKLAKKCIKSWKKYCPDYEIIEWNEDNYDLSSAPLYVRQAYEAKKWAFVTDYVRLHVVYEYGGIYMDTDVELIKPLDPLLQYNAYFGFEDGIYINTGLGFGAVKGSPILREMMDDYFGMSFDPTGKNVVACPRVNTAVFLKHGLLQDNKNQVLDDEIIILPTEYLCPKSVIDGITRKTKNTVSIHHYDSSWFTKESQIEKKKSWKHLQRIIRWNYILHFPHRLAYKILGSDKYEKFRKVLGRKRS